jgi:hypothetical protein
MQGVPRHAHDIEKRGLLSDSGPVERVRLRVGVHIEDRIAGKREAGRKV